MNEIYKELIQYQLTDKELVELRDKYKDYEDYELTSEIPYIDRKTDELRMKAHEYKKYSTYDNKFDVEVYDELQSKYYHMNWYSYELFMYAMEENYKPGLLYEYIGRTKGDDMTFLSDIPQQLVHNRLKSILRKNKIKNILEEL